MILQTDALERIQSCHVFVVVLVCCACMKRLWPQVSQVVAEGEQLMVSIAGSAMRFFWKLQLLCPPLFEWKWRNGMEQLKAYNKYSQPFEEIRTRVGWLGWARLGNRCLFSDGWDGVMVGWWVGFGWLVTSRRLGWMTKYISLVNSFCFSSGYFCRLSRCRSFPAGASRSSCRWSPRSSENDLRCSREEPQKRVHTESMPTITAHFPKNDLKIPKESPTV